MPPPPAYPRKPAPPPAYAAPVEVAALGPFPADAGGQGVAGGAGELRPVGGVLQRPEAVAAWVHWLKLGRGPWRPVAEGRSWGEAFGRGLRAELPRVQFLERIVLPAGERPRGK